MPETVVDEIEEYIHAKQIDVIFRAILVQCFRDRPTNAVEFVMNYLMTNYPDEVPDSMRMPQRAGDEVDIQVYHPNPEKNQYLNEVLDVSSLFGHLATQVAEAQPEDPVTFLVEAMQEVKDEELGHVDEPLEESADVARDMLEDFKRRAIITGRRPSVSAECDSASEAFALQRSGSFTKREIKKTPEERLEILDALETNILFKSLDDDSKETVVDAVYPVVQAAGTNIITQGDEGDNFYIIREGEAMVFMQMPDGESKHLVTYGPKSAFGELALMYGNQRAATVKAKSEVKLWALDRATFRAVIILSTAARRSNHEGFLKKVPILKCLTEQQRAQVADVMDSVKFSTNDYIIKQGEKDGTSFYILESGTAIAEYETPTGEVKDLRTYASGDFFGELAFLTDAPRAVSIKATSKVCCVTLDKSSFKRLLGRCETVLRDHLQEYQAAIQKYIGEGGVAH